MFKATFLATAVTLSALQAPTTAAAEALTILAGDLPPMFNGDGSGREAEVISSVMERCGHTVTFEIQPFTRHWKSYAQGKGDAVPGKKSESMPCEISDEPFNGYGCGYSGYNYAQKHGLTV